MPLIFTRGDLTKTRADAIVCPTDETFSASGGTDEAIRRKAGVLLRTACLRFGRMQTGEVRQTRGYRLPCNYIFHVVAPRWQGGKQGETQALAACYADVLAKAKESGCESIAFPLLGAGSFGIPHEIAMQTAVDAIRRAPQTDDMLVTLVLYDADCIRIARRYRFLDALPGMEPPVQAIMSCARMTNCEASPAGRGVRRKVQQIRERKETNVPRTAPAEPDSAEANIESEPDGCFAPQDLREDMQLFRQDVSSPSLEELLCHLDESFSQMLLRLIDERGMTDAECYKKANIDRKLFSKIRSNMLYKPSKATALAFAVALELPLDQARELLQKAGYAFSPSSKFDVIVSYYIARQNYDIYEINEALFAYDQSLLGC